MYLKKTTQYALYAAIEMASAGDSPVTVATAARHYQIPETVLAKVFQQLVRAGLARGSRGVGGGYRLARPASTISVLQILELFEPPTPAAGAAHSAPGHDRLRQLFAEVEETTRATFASVSLETLAR